MQISRTLKTVVAVIMFLWLVVGVGYYVETTGLCPSDMEYISAGRFVTGVTEKGVDYLYELCNETVGGCYKSWFTPEMPRRIINHKAFCIDKYEFPNRKGAIPDTGVTWAIAEQRCEFRGKRLCAEFEWERACKSTWEFNWSFGDTYEENVCNMTTGAVTASGNMPRCRSFENIFDMNGNVAEWVYDRPSAKFAKGAAVTKGGSFNDRPIFSRCTFKSMVDPRTQNDEIGFRCCSPARSSK